ncbi:MAG: porin [Moraxellaceae bacterium]|jgi:predicted porin|nr:porin [Moraxellaceae bacterium]
MNRTLIALGVAATVALPVVAEAAPKVYGKLNLSVEQYEKEFENPATKPDEFVRLQTNDSRFGVKGEDELTATLSAVYQIEWEVLADTAGATTDMKQRNRFVGIKSQDFGTVKLGAYDTYLKLAQGKADFFNDMFGDMKYVIAGENRVINVVGYESPKFLGGLNFNAMAQTQENAAGTKDSKNGNSASIVYDNSEIGLWVAIAMDNNINAATPLNSTARDVDALRAVVVYSIADLTVSAVYGTAEDSVGTAGNEEAGMTVGLAYKLGDQTLKAQYGTAEADLATAATQERTQWSFGVDHNFTAKTRAYVFYTAKEEDKLAALSDNEETSAGIGIEHNF